MMYRFLLLVFLLFISAPSMAAENLDYKVFSTLPVQHEGRIKPLDTLARSFLKSFSGRESIGGKNAGEWLAGLLFDPAEAVTEPVFRVLNPSAIGLTSKETNLYSYSEVFEALGRQRAAIEKLSTLTPKDWSDDQKQLMQLWEQSILYAQLLRSMAYLAPMEISIPPSLVKEWNVKTDVPFTLQDLFPYETRLKEKVAQIVKRKGSNPERYNEREREIAAFSFFFDTIKNNSAGNIVLRVIPPEQGEEWLSPWSALQARPATQTEFIAFWSLLAAAYGDNNAAQFSSVSQEMAKAYAPYIGTHKIRLENIYNGLHPVGLAMIGYLLSFLALAAYFLSDKRLFYKPSAAIILTSGLLHAAAIAMRVVILSRPPVGTLYESILFVSLVIVLGALLIERQRKDGTGILTGSLCGALLLFVSEAFASEDSLTILVAVLNTNFWLATHVLCITIGYGLCLITSALAHIYLIKMAAEQNSNLLPSIKTVGLMALLFTSVGTILGGIWADQSWGRFWGWDPKENGALLIVLWLAWSFHGHISGHLKTTAFTASMAALSIIVALAWFGVNLLNVGLHSYGFITGVAASLFAFCAVELSVIGFFWRRIYGRKEAV